MKIQKTVTIYQVELGGNRLDSLSLVSTQFSIYGIHTAIKRTLTQFSLNLVLAPVSIILDVVIWQTRKKMLDKEHNMTLWAHVITVYPTPPPFIC